MTISDSAARRANWAIDDERVNDRLAKMSSEECRKLIGSLYQRMNLSDEEYIKMLPSSPFCFDTVEHWLQWMDAEQEIAN
jgi:hypothetical protein